MYDPRPGNPTKPPRYREDIRPKRNPKTEREAQPPPAGIKDRCSSQQSADRGDDAAGHGEYGGCGEGHGGRDEEYGS